MIIAIDGPAGSGKSTIAKRLAKKLHFEYLDSGAIYRALTWKALKLGIDPLNCSELQTLALELGLRFEANNGGPQRVFLEGQDISREIRTSEVDQAVSLISAHPEVRQALISFQRDYGKYHNLVAEGRDMGTIVFPEAQLKIFLTADPAIRAHRRALEHADEEEAKRRSAQVAARDELDTKRKTAPLIPAADAIIIDSTALDIGQVMARIIKEVEKLQND